MTFFCAHCDIRTQCGGPTKNPDLVLPTSLNWFDSALVADRFQFHFQPVVDLESGSVAAHESLVRLHQERWYSGGEIIDAAVQLGRVHVFDAYCRMKAIRTAAGQARSGSLVFVNFMPSSIYDPNYCLQSTLKAMSETRLRSSDVVFEVVESEHVRSIPNLLKIRDFYRRHGFGFALDDCGAGSNTVSMVERFEPDYLKLDKSLTGTAPTPEQQQNLEKLLELGQRLGCRIIAEGIETPEQARTLRMAGVKLMQGWLFGKPAAEMRFAESLASLGSALEPVSRVSEPAPAPSA